MVRRRGWSVRSHRVHRRQTLVVGAVFAVIVVAVGIFAGAAVLPSRSSAQWQPGGAGRYAATGATPTGASPAGTATAHLSGPPTRVRIPRIGVDSSLVRLALDVRGALQAPTVFDRAGWYAGGTAPGDVGPAVIAGHVDSVAGAAVFFRLGELRPGDRVEVSRGGGWIGFQVVSVSRYPKDQFPTAAVYGPTPDPQLRLITCGGTFDRVARSYVDNIVVYAVEN